MISGEQDGSRRAAAETVERRGGGPEAPADKMEKRRFQEEAARENRQPGGFGQPENIVVLEQDPEFRRGVRFVPRRAMIDQEIAPVRIASGEASRPLSVTSPRPIFSRHSASVEWR